MRAYKQSEHFIVYARMHNSPEKATGEQDFMRSLPDSPDIVTLTNADNFSKFDAEDMSVMHEKGTKVLYQIDYAARAEEFADAAALGSRYEEALQAVSLAARQGISLYCVKEGLRIDALFPQTFDRAAEICLQLYKAVLSIRNKGIQDELKRTGKKRGRPFGTAAVSSLDGRNREIFDGLRQGLAKAEIARRLGVGRTTLYLYLKKNEDAGLRTGTDGAGRAGAGKNGGSGAGAGRGVAAGAGRGEIGLQANKAIYDRNRT